MEGKRPEPEEVAEFNKSIAELVRSIRKRKGLTQADMSRRSGVSLGAVKRFEKTGNITLLSFSKLVIALGFELELLKLFYELKKRVY